MPLPTATAPALTSPWTLNPGAYNIPASLKPDNLTAGTPRDEIGRAPYSDTWIRYGDGLPEPQPIIFRGVLFGDDVHTQLDALRAAVQAATSITWDDQTITLQGGDVDVGEDRRKVIAVTVYLLPTAEGVLA